MPAYLYLLNKYNLHNKVLLISKHNWITVIHFCLEQNIYDLGDSELNWTEWGTSVQAIHTREHFKVYVYVSSRVLRLSNGTP